MLPGTLHTFTLTGRPLSLTSCGPSFGMEENDDCCGLCSIYFPTVSLQFNPPLPLPINLTSRTITANSLSQHIMSSETLIPGGSAITVNGSPISLPAHTSAIVVGSSTEILATTIGAGIGAAVLSGLGPIEPGKPTATAEANASYTGPLFAASTGCVGNDGHGSYYVWVYCCGLCTARRCGWLGLRLDNFGAYECCGRVCGD